MNFLENLKLAFGWEKKISEVRYNKVGNKECVKDGKQWVCNVDGKPIRYDLDKQKI